MNELDIFSAALERQSREERERYLDEACSTDPKLRRRIEELLGAHAQAGSFRGVAAVDRAEHATMAAPVREQSGMVIGPYKLVEQIGEGGMGTVWMAQQTEPVKRVLALKLIKAGMDSRQVIARFEAERQALALMDHANIARVLDAGTTAAGRPYFVMDLVKGQPITMYCDEHHLTPRQRLELFIPVCLAIQHAHQKGIIHRDLKPSNVLVALCDGKPVPKVIDFGVAKAAGQSLTDKTLVTGFGAIVGTLEYMSPEQAEVNQLDIDTRSDIYSLGVLLYELLTGTPPFSRKELENAGLLEMLRVIREEEPSKPSTKLSSSEALPSLSANRGTEPAKLTKLVRGELDWIVMRALEKDRSRRYETANGFAQDLQRYLSDEPVQACLPSAAYRLRKFLRRNKGPVLAAMLVLLSLLAGIVGTTWGMFRAERERDDKAKALIAETEAKEAAIKEREAKEKALTAETEAKEAAIKARVAKERALEAETKARQAEKQTRDKALAALRDMTDVMVENQMARDSHLTEENKAFLRRMIKHYESLASVTAGDAESRAIQAEGYCRVGLMRDRLGEQKEAESAYLEGLALRKQLAADFPSEPALRRDLASSHNNLGALLCEMGRLEDAEVAWTNALALRKELAADFPARSELCQELAQTHSNLGVLLGATERFKEAEAAYRDALALYKQLAADFPIRAELRQELARSHNNLGNLLSATDRLKEAETAMADALDLQKKLTTAFPARPEFRHDLAKSYVNLGNVLSAAARPKEAEAAFGKAVTLLKQSVAEFPARPELRQQLAASYSIVVSLLSTTGRLKEAEAVLATALALRKQLAADFPSRPEFRDELAQSQNDLGVLLDTTGRPKEAEAAYGDALALRKQLAADFPTRPAFRQGLATSHYNLGLLHREMGRLNEAETAYRDALALQKQLVADFPARPNFREELAGTCNNLGSLLRAAGRPKEAETFCADALTLLKQLVVEFPMRPEFRQGLAQSQHNLGNRHSAAGRFEEAETDYAEALAAQKQLVADSPNQPHLRNDLANTYRSLALLRLRQQEYQGMKANLEEAMPHLESALKANPRYPRYRQEYGNILGLLSRANAGLGDQRGAKQAAQKLCDLGWNPPGDAYVAACVLSLCIPIVRNDGQATGEERDRQAQFYSDEAMKMLRVAIGKGYDDAAHMKQDKDLDSLRGQDEFKKLMVELEAKK